MSSSKSSIKTTLNAFIVFIEPILISIQWPLILLIVGSLLCLGIFFGILPAEDAAILYLYSDNLAETGSITYSLNGEIEEGATDFLWMVILSVGSFLGIGTFKSALFLNGLALALSCYVLSRLSDSNKHTVLVALIFILVATPGILSSLVGFSTCFFFGTILLAVHLLSRQKVVPFLLVSTLAALTRPEGIIALSALIGFYFLSFAKDRKAYLWQAFTFFVLPILCYWVWRTLYFENVIPLPLQIKALGSNSFNYIWKTGWFHFTSVVIATSIYLIHRRKSAHTPALIPSLLLLLIVFSVLYGLSTLSQNVFHRFTYYIPLFSFAILIAIHSSLDHKIHRRIVLILFICLMLFQLANSKLEKNIQKIEGDKHNSTVFIAKEIAKENLTGRALVSEAGRFSYYSKWPSIDSWGLNTKQFTNELISPDYVRKEHFDVILLHPTGKSLDRLSGGESKHLCMQWADGNILKAGAEKSWTNMSINMVKGLDSELYDLILVPYSQNQEVTGLNSLGRYDCYFISKDYPEKAVLIKIFNKIKHLKIWMAKRRRSGHF